MPFQDNAGKGKLMCVECILNGLGLQKKQGYFYASVKANYGGKTVVGLLKLSQV